MPPKKLKEISLANATRKTAKFLGKNSYVSDIASGLTGVAAGTAGGAAAGVVAGGLASGALNKFAGDGGEAVAKKVDKLAKSKGGRQFSKNYSMAKKVLGGDVKGAWSEFKHPRGGDGKFESSQYDDSYGKFVEFVSKNPPHSEIGRVLSRAIIDEIDSDRYNYIISEIYEEFVNSDGKIDFDYLAQKYFRNSERSALSMHMADISQKGGLAPQHTISGFSSSLRGGKLESVVIFNRRAHIGSKKLLEISNKIPVDFNCVEDGVIEFLSESDSDKAKRFFVNLGINVICEDNIQNVDEGFSDVVRGTGSRVAKFVSDHPGATAALAGGAAAIAGGIAAATKRLPPTVTNAGKLITNLDYVQSVVRIVEIFVRVVETLANLRSAIRNHPTIESALSSNLDRMDDSMDSIRRDFRSRGFGSSGPEGFPSVEEIKSMRVAK